MNYPGPIAGISRQHFLSVVSSVENNVLNLGARQSLFHLCSSVGPPLSLVCVMFYYQGRAVILRFWFSMPAVSALSISIWVLWVAVFWFFTNTNKGILGAKVLLSAQEREHSVWKQMEFKVTVTHGMPQTNALYPRPLILLKYEILSL